MVDHKYLQHILYYKARNLCVFALLSLITAGCFQPPFNNFKQPSSPFIASFLAPLKKERLIRALRKEDIQLIEYGDTMTLLIPTDHYFVQDTAELNDICYQGLNNVVQLLRLYPGCKIYVAAFSDDIGTGHQKLYRTTGQAEAMLSFLWASHIKASRLEAKGYGDLFAIGDNALIHGSAYNRRIEIQWSKVCPSPRFH